MTVEAYLQRLNSNSHKTLLQLLRSNTFIPDLDMHGYESSLHDTMLLAYTKIPTFIWKMVDEILDADSWSIIHTTETN